MGKGGRRKTWPRSWRQAAVVGGTMTLQGRGFEKEYVVLPLKIEAETPPELEKGVDEPLADAAQVQRPS